MPADRCCSSGLATPAWADQGHAPPAAACRLPPPQIGDGLPIAVSLVAIAMGLNLLELLPLRLPSLDVDVRGLGVPPAAQAYLAGAHERAVGAAWLPSRAGRLHACI